MMKDLRMTMGNSNHRTDIPERIDIARSRC